MIYIIGSSNVDMVIRTRCFPRPGETVMGYDFLMNPGGKGANQAVAAARLEGNVRFAACVGDDLFGEQSIRHLQDEKIDCSLVETISATPSGVALISVDERGENCIVVAPGANRRIDCPFVDRVLQNISPDDILLLQLEIPLKAVLHAIQTARQKGVRIILNPAPASPLEDDALEGLFLITPNETEAEALTGVPVTDEKSAANAGMQLIRKGVQNVMITMGARGVLLVTKDITVRIAAPPVTPLDTTAAGDCFNGAMAVALSSGMALEAAADWACRAASISVTRQGAQKSMPWLNELQ